VYFVSQTLNLLQFNQPIPCISLKMEKYSILILAVMATVSSAFAPVSQIRRSVVAFSSTISMPANADQLHLHQPLTDKNVDTSANLDISIPERVDSIQNLKDTEFAIDGIIYDTQGFKHPGGDSFLAFGGNDVTAMYHMIHPLHTPNHLKKLKKVGRVLDWKQEYVYASFLMFASLTSEFFPLNYCPHVDMSLIQSLPKKSSEKYSRL
jgi:hypothetical protein